MTSLMARAMAGSILDLPVDPRLVFHYVVNRPYGPPIKQIDVKPKEAAKPLTLGDERHHQLISAIKNINVQQKVKQDVISDALPQSRDWR